MVKALFDTNILIDHLRGVPQARRELSRFNDKAISVVSFMEVMIGVDASVEPSTRAFLLGFDIVALEMDVVDRAIELRRKHRIKLPDAIIWASAQTHGMLLVTRNTKGFPSGDPGIRHPYTI